MYKVLILFLLSSSFFANEILDIKKDFITHDSSNFLYHIQDINNKFTATDILNNPNLKLTSKVHLGQADGPFWTKLTLKNSSEKKQFLSLYNPVAGTNYVDVYIFKNYKQITFHQLGDLQEQTKREEISRYSMFNLFLDKKEEVTIIARVENYSIYNIGWNIKKKSSYTHTEILYTLYFGIFTGIAILFAFYHLFAYRIYKKLTYLIVTLNVLFVLMYLHGVNGTLYQVNMGINLDLITAITWNAGTLIIIGLTLFPYYFFNLKNNYPKLNGILDLS